MTHGLCSNRNVLRHGKRSVCPFGLFVCLFVYIVCISGLCMSRNLFSTKQCFILIATCNLKVLHYCHFLVSVN